MESYRLKQVGRESNSRENVKLSGTPARARGWWGRVGSGRELQSRAGGRRGWSAPGRPGGGASDGSCAPVTRGDSGLAPFYPAALRASRWVPQTAEQPAWSQVRGGPGAAPPPADLRSGARRPRTLIPLLESPGALSESLGLPFGPRGSGPLHTRTWAGPRRGSQRRCLPQTSHYGLLGEPLPP